MGGAVDIMKVNGMMAIRLECGENDICFEYDIPGFRMGIVISMIAVLLFVIYLVGEKWYCRK